jgi:hypothetical protein
MVGFATSPCPLMRLLDDVLAFDQPILDSLMQRHPYETAMQLMRDVYHLRKLGYPPAIAIDLAERLAADRMRGACP